MAAHPPSRIRYGALLVVMLTLMAACTGEGDTPDQRDSEDAADSPADADGTAGGTADAGDPSSDPDDDMAIPIAAGATPDVDPDIAQAAQRWIEEESGLSDMLKEELFLQSVSITQDVHHLTYVQEHGEVAVQGAVFIVHVTGDGEVLAASQSLTNVLPGEDTAVVLDEDEAIATAAKQVPGTVVGDPVVTATWLEVGAELRLGWDVTLSTSDPVSNYAVVVDATNGDVLSVEELVIQHSRRRAVGGPRLRSTTSTATTAAITAATSATTTAATSATTTAVTDQVVAQSGALCDAPAPPSACIFVVDPIYASGNPSITPEQANATLVGVPLGNLLDPADGLLVGRYAQIHAPIADDYEDSDNVFGERGRGGLDITFEAAMTYYWIDYTQSLMQALGYAYHADDPVDFVPIQEGFSDNARYLLFDDRIEMGDAADGVVEAEDASGTIHEYGHAILNSQIPRITSEEGGAFHEGFADLVAVFTTLEFRDGDVGCLFHWADRGTCLRRIDTDLAHPDDLRFEVHLDAEIFTGAVWDVFEEVLARDTGLTPSECQDRSALPCNDVRDQVYGTLLGSLPFLTPTLTLQDAADAFALSDASFHGGVNADIIADVFAAHGLSVGDGGQIITTGDDGQMADIVPGGAATEVAVKVAHSFRGDLQVDVAVLGPDDELLCAPVRLVTPDEADDADNITGRFDVTTSDCAAFAPPDADQRWILRIIDTLPEDTGELRQLAIYHEGVRHLATSLPVNIPDDDALGVFAFVGGDVPPPADAMTDGETSPAPTQDPSTADGVVSARIVIEHSYIGDLAVQLAVVDFSVEEVLCTRGVLDPDPGDATADLDITVDATGCIDYYPPRPDQEWVLRLLDNAPADVGQLVVFDLTGPDGQTRSLDGPTEIPDNGDSGIFVGFDE